MTAMLTRRGYGPVDTTQAARFFDALSVAGPACRWRSTTARASATRSRRRSSSPGGFASGSSDSTVADAGGIFTELRTVKTPYERTVFAQSLDISVDAQKAGMRAAHPGRMGIRGEGGD